MTELASDARPAPWTVSRWIRQIHRWLSIIFTLSVIATFVALTLPEPLVWVSYIPLLLMATGLYMLALPNAARWRSKGGVAR